jgi:hypothetical protein
MRRIRTAPKTTIIIAFYPENNYDITHFFFFKSSSPLPHLYSVQVILLSTLVFFTRRKEMISAEDEGVCHAEIPNEMGVV